jgi:hypothetical protein
MEQLQPAIDELKNLVLLGPAALVILVAIHIGAGLKRWQRIPDWTIPFILAPLCGAGYAVLAKVWNQDYRATMLPVNIGLGILFGFSSVGIHQAIRQNSLLRNLPILSFLVPPNGNTEIIKKDDVKE